MSFSLIGKVGLDVSGFHQGLAKLGGAAAPLGKQVGDQMRGAILGAVGAGALVSGIKASLKKAFDIRKDSTKLDLTPELFQTLDVLQGQTGTSVEAMVEQMRSGTDAGNEFAAAVEALNAQLLEQNAILDGENVKKLAGYQDKLESLTAKLGVGFGWMAGLAADVVDYGTRAAEQAAGLGMSAFGAVTGDKAMFRGGLEMADDARLGRTSESAAGQVAVVAAAKELAVAIGRESGNKHTGSTSVSAASGGSASYKARHYAEGMAEYGRSLGGTTTERQLALIHRTLLEMNGNLRDGGIR